MGKFYHVPDGCITKMRLYPRTWHVIMNEAHSKGQTEQAKEAQRRRQAKERRKAVRKSGWGARGGGS